MPLVMGSSLCPLSKASVSDIFLPWSSLGGDWGVRELWPMQQLGKRGVLSTGKATRWLSLMTIDPWMGGEGSILEFCFCFVFLGNFRMLWVQLKKINAKFSWGCGATWPLIHCWFGCFLHSWTQLLRDPIISFLCMKNFEEILFLIAKNWKDPKCILSVKA